MGDLNCWICNATIPSTKFVTHIRGHTNLEAKIAYQRDLKEEKKKREKKEEE